MDKQSSTSNRLINISLGIIVIFLVVWVLIIGRTIILPFMIALFLTFILDPVVSLLTRWKIPVSLAVFLTILFAFIILYLLGMLVYANVQNFVEKFPEYEVQLRESLGNFSVNFEQWFGKPLTLQGWEEINWLDTLQSLSIPKRVLTSVGTFVTFVLKMLLVIIFIAYLLSGKRYISKKIYLAFPENQAKRIVTIIENVTDQVQKYIGAKTLVSFITGVISIIIFYAFGLDFAIFWGFIIFLFNYIPNIGSIIASLLPVLFSLLQFGSIPVAFWIMISMIILQLSMGNILEPRLMGRTLNLSPLIVILSLIFWGYIWGVAGMILAVPILATLTIIFENIESLKPLSVFLRGKKQ